MPPGKNKDGKDLADVLFVEVEKEQAEGVRRCLLRQGFLNFRVRVISDTENVSFPLIEHVSGDDIGALFSGDTENDELPTGKFPFSLSRRSVPLLPFRPSSFRDVVNVPTGLRSFLPSSWDVVGSIILVKLADEVTAWGQEIARALLSVHPGITSVYRVMRIGGERRVRELEHIGGEKSTLTAAREYGLTLWVDVGRTYYSPRLATERWRVVSDVKPGERVLDMFAGVGPFSLLISRHASPSEVHAVDINPDAVKLLERNIEANSLENVTAHLGDAREVCASLAETGSFHRIIMNLPHSSTEFLPTTLGCADVGTVIHLYLIEERDELEGVVEECIGRASEMGFTMKEKRRVEVRGYSPSEVNVCSDLVVEGVGREN